MLPTPAHDGVRLILPCFPFLAALAGWGTAWVAGLLGRRLPDRAAAWCAPALLSLVLLPAAWATFRVQPYGLSYFNRLIGGPRGAWAAGFELSYWYDAFTPQVLADLDARLPRDAAIAYASDQSNPVMVLQDLQALGQLRSELRQWDSGPGGFPYMLLLTHDSKASSFTRLLFAMTPWYASRPAQLDGLRVLTVADPVAISRAWALHLLTHGRGATPEVAPPAAPAWVRRLAPPLARLWGDGLTRVARPDVNEPVFQWAREDPAGLVAAADCIAAGQPVADRPDAARLLAILTRDDDPAAGRDFSGMLLRNRPEALGEAARILNARPDAVRQVLTSPPYLDPERVGGPLDARLDAPEPAG
jgi:hypothetical protein